MRLLTFIVELLYTIWCSFRIVFGLSATYVLLLFPEYSFFDSLMTAKWLLMLSVSIGVTIGGMKEIWYKIDDT